jgi:hypothetical protein
MTRTWQDNAHEFGALIKQGRDVRLALLVACSVEKPHNGRPTAAQLNERKVSGKTSASEFARESGETVPRVLRHLKAWGELEDAKPASSLKPSDVETYGAAADETPPEEIPPEVFEAAFKEEDAHKDVADIVEAKRPDLPAPQTREQKRQLSALQADPDLMVGVWEQTLKQTDGKPTASVIKGLVKEQTGECLTPKLIKVLHVLHVLRDLMDETRPIIDGLGVSDLGHLSWSELDRLDKYSRDAHVIFRRLKELDQSKPAKTATHLRAV